MIKFLKSALTTPTVEARSQKMLLNAQHDLLTAEYNLELWQSNAALQRRLIEKLSNMRSDESSHEHDV